jgi:ABC-2 type transport system permease protein
MRGLIKNEILKLGRKSKLYIVIAFLVLVTVIQCYAKHTEITAKTPEKIIAECERLIENMKNVTVIQHGGSGDGEGGTVIDSISETIENAKKEIERAQQIINNRGRDWRINVREEIAYYERRAEEAKAEGDVVSQESNAVKINMLNYYLDNDMKPEEEYIFKNTVILDIMTYIGNIFLFVVVMILTVETIADENSSGTIKLLLTKPVSRGKIFISKFLASLIASLGIVIIIETLAYLVIGVIFGFGNMQAPAAICTKYEPDPILIARYGMGVKPILGSTIIVPLWQKLVMVLALQTIFIVTVVSFGMLISAIMKNGISAMILGLLITTVFTVLTVQVSDFGKIKPVAIIMPYLFSTYSAGSPILTGYLSKHLNSTLIGAPFAILVMVAWAVLFFIAGLNIFAKKDVLA